MLKWAGAGAYTHRIYFTSKMRNCDGFVVEMYNRHNLFAVVRNREWHRLPGHRLARFTSQIPFDMAEQMLKR